MEENSDSHKDEKRSFKRRFLIWLIPFLVVNLQRLIGLTSRRINIGDESIRKIRKEKKPYILSGWHTNVLYSPYLNRNERMAILISESKDGDFINQVVHRFGNYSIRGSSSKGGPKALKALIVHLKKNFLRRLLPMALEAPRL